MTTPASEGRETSIDYVWDRLNLAFTAIYAEVLRNTATVTWLAEANSNSSFPLMAYARFDRNGRASDEALVIAVDLHSRDGITRWTADAAQENGAVLAQGPTRSWSDRELLSSWIGEATDVTIAWLQSETPNFVAYLNQEPTPYDVD